MPSLPVDRRPTLVDALLAGLFAVVIGVEAFTEPGVSSGAVHAALALPAMAAMALRRAWPLGTTVFMVGIATLLAIDGGGSSIALALVVMSFSVGAETESTRRSLIGLGITFVPFMASSIVDYGRLYVGDVAAATVFTIAPWSAGRTLRERAARLAEALARSDRLEREREQEATAAALRERTRLARELHDVVSHSISVITIQTQAVRRRLGPDHQREIDDLAAVETTARDAMAEMRRLFGVLRRDGEGVSLAPQPGLRDLDQLIDQAKGTGVAVDLERGGEVVDLPPGLELAAYRIVQEGLTNALRHSDGHRIRVTLDYGPSALVLGVEDDGTGLAMPRESQVDGPGHGLVGIRERAEMYGGTLALDRGDLGGTRLRARLPVAQP